MNKNAIKNFMNKYGFYVAVGGIGVVAVVSVLFIPDSRGTVENEPERYAINEDAIGESVTEDIVLPSGDLTFDPAILEEYLETEDSEPVREEIIVDSESMADNLDIHTEEVVENEEQIVEEAVETLNFTESSQIDWPVSGDIIVPFKDENTDHWFSEGLGQTMRTLGVCISASEGEAIVAAAGGVIEDVITVSTSIDSLKYVGDVGDVIVIDHGNGYKTLYGTQEGSAYTDKIGERVEAGEAIGIVGSPKGPFISEGINVYLQMTYQDEIINPESFLVEKE